MAAAAHGFPTDGQTSPLLPTSLCRPSPAAAAHGTTNGTDECGIFPAEVGLGTGPPVEATDSFTFCCFFFLVERIAWLGYYTRGEVSPVLEIRTNDSSWTVSYLLLHICQYISSSHCLFLLRSIHNNNLESVTIFVERGKEEYPPTAMATNVTLPHAPSPLASPLGAPVALFRALPSPAAMPLSYAATALLLLVGLYSAALGGTRGRGAASSNKWLPLASPARRVDVGGVRKLVDYFRDGFDLMQGAKDRFGDRPFRMYTESGETTILPPRFANEVKSNPKVSFEGPLDRVSKPLPFPPSSLLRERRRRGEQWEIIADLVLLTFLVHARPSEGIRHLLQGRHGKPPRRRRREARPHPRAQQGDPATHRGDLLRPEAPPDRRDW